MAKKFQVGNRFIGDGQAPYIIAEMSGNHNGDINRALDLVRAAKKAGAHAVKLQTYTADTMTIDHRGEGFEIKGGLWDGRTLYDLYEEAHTPWEWHHDLFNLARKLDIDIFSSPFDESAVDFLEQFDPPFYKVASFEMTDMPLLEKIAATGRPVIMSTGMATFEEIQESVDILRQSGVSDLVVLHCITGYPTPVDDVNLRTMTDLGTRLDVAVGLSDHTMGTTVAVGAVALGACIIEKHFTLRRSDGGPDAAFSLEPDELTQLVDDTHTIFSALGTAGYHQKSSEQTNAKYRRSVYVVEDIEEGAALNSSNIRRIRPGFGLPPREYNNVLGHKARRKLSRGTPLSLEDIE